MKKSISILIVSVLFFLPLISAVEFNMNDSFKQGETILAKVSGNFLTSVTKDNVFFYRGHVQIPIEYNIANIGGDYYIYAITTGKNESNYSISIENVKYMSGANIINDKIVKNFSITNETADFSVNPGFVDSSGSFYLEVQNLLEKGITLDVNTETNFSERDIFISPNNVKEDSISLKSGEIKKINFVMGVGGPTFQNIELSSGNFTYETPVYIYSSSETGIAGEKSLSFEPSDIITSFPTNTTATRTFYLYNKGSSEVKNISISLSDSLSPYVNISENIIENLSAGSHVPIELSFFSSGETEIEGTLKAESGNFSASSFISFKFISNYTISNETAVASKTCAELNGTTCTENQKCDSDPVYAKDNVCCLTTCQQIQKSNSSIVIAVILIILVALLLVWFYFAKYKKAKKPVDFLKASKPKK